MYKMLDKSLVRQIFKNYCIVNIELRQERKKVIFVLVLQLSFSELELLVYCVLFKQKNK